MLYDSLSAIRRPSPGPATCEGAYSHLEYASYCLSCGDGLASLGQGRASVIKEFLNTTPLGSFELTKVK